MSTGLSGLLSDSPSDTSVTSGHDDGLHSIHRVQKSVQSAFVQPTVHVMPSDGTDLAREIDVPTGSDHFCVCFAVVFVGKVGVKGSSVMMQTYWLLLYRNRVNVERSVGGRAYIQLLASASLDLSLSRVSDATIEGSREGGSRFDYVICWYRAELSP
jgi:hypothetical protein